MACRRMFHTDVICSDAFLELPFSAQALYIQLCMAADDDGFVNGARRIAGQIDAKSSDLEMLIQRRFLLEFEKIIVIKHWRLANSLKNDRLRPTTYPEVAEKIYLKSNRIYTDHPEPGAINLQKLKESQMSRSGWNPFGIPREERRTEKNLTEENRTEVEGDGIQDPEESDRLQVMAGHLGKGVVFLTDEQTEDLLAQMGLDCFDYYVDKLSSFILTKGVKVKNHYKTLLRWWQEDCKK